MSTGNRVARSGALDARAVFDHTDLALRNAAAGSNPADQLVYPPGKDTSNIAPGEIVLRRRMQSAMNSELSVSASLNSVGGAASREFMKRKRPRLARAALKREYEPCGVAVTDYTVDESGKCQQQQGLVVTFAGLNTIYAHKNVHPGQLIKADFPDPSIRFDRDRPVPKGINPDKVQVQGVPYSPKDMADETLDAMRMLLEDPATFHRIVKEGGPASGCGQWENAAARVMGSALVSGIMTVYNLLRSKDLQVAGNLANLTEEQAAMRLFDAFGLFSDAGAHVNGSQFGNLTAADRANLRATRARILMSVFNTENSVEGGFAMGNDNVWLSGHKGGSNEINACTPAGKVMEIQRNHYKHGLCAMADAVIEDQAFIIGKCVRGATPGHTMDVALGWSRIN